MVSLDNQLVIGVDFGGTNIKGALVNDQGKIIYKVETATLANSGPEAVAGRIGQMINKLEAFAEAGGQRAVGIGIGIPGQTDQNKGEVVFAPNLHWRHVPLLKYLGQVTSLPILMENDANAAALGEQWCGAGRGSVNMVMITIGTGIGGGLIINGSLYQGSNGCAGELGHTVIDPKGFLCSCGRRGCLETLTSATAMIRMAKEAIDQGRITDLVKPENIDAKDIVMAARAGDEVALEIINFVADYLGMSIGNLINVLNPDTVVVGGGVSKAGEILFEPLRRSIMKWSLEAPASNVKIIPAELGNDAGFIGAACLILQKMC